MAEPLHVVATAGHVDHGKSSLILRLTGIDPDRWEEEKRRGLTIDLGFAWCVLPSGREVGFVDVPGHERFVRNMLAGVGPVRLVLFVVAADEGWKPQSEEHLAIVDVLGVHGGVVALSKADLVDEETLAIVVEDVRERLAGTPLQDAPMVTCSSVTGLGLDELRAALDAMAARAPDPEDRGRPRLAVDRSFTIRGAGTVVTGTLTGGTLSVGDDARVYPDGGRHRIRSLQTHRRAVQTARPVSRVAANLAGVPRQEVRRGDVLGLPGQWRPTAVLEGEVVPVRSLAHPLTARGAYKVYLGSSERDARLRLYGAATLPPGERAFARLRLSVPVVAAVGDRFVLREAGRRETVAGGVVLDPDPPTRPGSDAEGRLRRRAAAGGEVAGVLLRERGAAPAPELVQVLGRAPDEIPGAARIGGWWVEDRALAAVERTVLDTLAAHHRDHPLRPGLDAAEVRRRMAAAHPELGPALERGLAAEIQEHLEGGGRTAREGTVLRLATHRVTLGEREEEAGRLVAAVADGEPAPPTVRDLLEAGYAGDLIDACIRTGRLVGVSDEVVLTPAFHARAETVARAEAVQGLTVSRFRELLGTTRKYALPILASFDARGVTRRDGDVRRPGPRAAANG